MVHGLEMGMLLREYCSVCREYTEIANKAGGAADDAEDLCQRLERALGQVKAGFTDERFRAHGIAVAEKMCLSIDAFFQSFAKAVGRGKREMVGEKGANVLSLEGHSDVRRYL